MSIPAFTDADARLRDDAHGFLLLLDANDRARTAGVAWFREHRGALRAALDRFGAIFLRGWDPDSHAFESIVDAIAGDPLGYAGGVSPRSQVHGSIYTATDAPPPLAIVQHHEMSYHRFTPHYLGFYCDTPPPDGGATPLTDGRRFARTLAEHAPDVMDALEARGVLFVRNYNEANFKGWREAWGTSDKAELERMLRDAGVTWEWLGDDWLRTRHRLPAVRRDPASGERILFSCVHLWHRWYVAKMNAATGVPLPDDPAKQPYATFFGDGEAIPEDFVVRMHETFDAQAIAIPYRRHDVVLLNNLLATHGRQAYTPPRKVYATLRERVFLDEDPSFARPS